MRAKLFTIMVLVLLVLLPVCFAETFRSSEGLVPYQTYNVQIRKRTVDDVAAYSEAEDKASAVEDAWHSLDENDEVYLTIERYDSILEKSNPQFVSIKKNSTETLALLPGEYKISAFLIPHTEVTLERDKRTRCKGIEIGTAEFSGSTVAEGLKEAGGAVGASYITSLLGIGSFLGPVGLTLIGATLLASFIPPTCIGTEEDIWIPPLDQDLIVLPESTPLGGAEFNYTFTQSSLEQDKNTIVFYVFEFEPPRLIEELEVILDYQEFSTRYLSLVKPKLINI